MRSPVVTDTGIWDVKTWAYREPDLPNLPTGVELRTRTKLEEFLQRGYDAAKGMRQSAEAAGYTVLEDPQFHVLMDPALGHNQPAIVCTARVISRGSGITSLRLDLDRPQPVPTSP